MSQFLGASPEQAAGSELCIPPGARTANGLVLTEELTGIPLVTDITPESLSFRIIGDKRYTHIALGAIPAGLELLMVEEIGAAVMDKEPEFFEKPWDRVIRSLPHIIGGVVDMDAEATGRSIRDKHKNVRGTDEHGVSYNALDVKAFKPAHYMFVKSLFETGDRHMNLDLTLPSSREQLYQETRVWAGRYGLPKLTAEVAPTYAEFREEWQDLVDNRFMKTPAASYVIEKCLEGDIPPLPGTVWDMAWRAKPVRSGVSRVVGLAALGGLAPSLRERLEIPFSAKDEARLERLDSIVRLKQWDHLPNVVLLHKRARRGISDREKRDKELLKAAA
jgi:uncharacterized protein (DUF2236 family)